VLLVAHPLERVRAVIAMAAMDSRDIVVLAASAAEAHRCIDGHSITAAIVADPFTDAAPEHVLHHLYRRDCLVPTLVLRGKDPLGESRGVHTLWLVEPFDIGVVCLFLVAVWSNRVTCAARSYGKAHGLSPREVELLGLYAAGSPWTELPLEMGVASPSVVTYRRRIERKCSRSFEAVAAAVVRVVRAH
jgi:DNA-binding CsgD family transcriptional regulator